MKKYALSQAEYSRKRRNENRAWAIHLLGGKCARCGSTHQLEFDHKDPSTMSFRIATYIGWNREKLVPELMKCQLLCSPCHRKKTALERNYSGRPIKHGTAGAYTNRKCRCAQCTQAWAFYIAERKRVRLVT